MVELLNGGSGAPDLVWESWSSGPCDLVAPDESKVAAMEFQC